MSSYSEEICCFDQNCKLCEDADVTLEFDDKTTLMAHSFILKKASPVFKIALTEFEETSVLKLQYVSRHVWLCILRELYPTQFYLTAHTFFNIPHDEIIWIAKECEKYQINSIIKGIDALLVCKLSQTMVPLHPKKWKDFNHLVAIVAEIDLPLSRDRMLEITVNAMCEVGKKTWNAIGQYPRALEPVYQCPIYMTNTIDMLLQADHQYGEGQFARKIVRDVLQIPVENKRPRENY